METILPTARWYRLLPIVFITYSLAYVDRANVGFAAAGGMAADLHMTANLSALLGALFFLGYFCFQIPGALYAQQRTAKQLIFWALILWGALATATGLISSVHLLMLIRFLLGVVEGAVMAPLLLLLSRWFTKAERSRANSFFLVANPATILWMSILSGYLIQALGWRWMFILEGLPAILWAFVWERYIDDTPGEAKWLSHAEKQALAERLQQEQQGIRPVRNYAQAFQSHLVILLSLQYAFWHVGLYGLVMWLPTRLHSAAQISLVQTGWLAAAPYVLAIIGMVSAAYFSDKTLNRNAFIWPFLLLGALAFYGSYVLGAQHFWLSYTLLVLAGGAMYAPYGPFFALIAEHLPSQVSGGAMALINSCGALGSFVGAYVVGRLNGLTGDFSRSSLFMAVCLFLAALLGGVALKTRAPIRSFEVV